MSAVSALVGLRWKEPCAPLEPISDLQSQSLRRGRGAPLGRFWDRLLPLNPWQRTPSGLVYGLARRSANAPTVTPTVGRQYRRRKAHACASQVRTAQRTNA